MTDWIATPDDADGPPRVPSGESIKLFVYGTLKSGHPNHWLMSCCTHEADAAVHGTLYSLRRYPAATFLTSDPRLVHGEIYDVPGYEVEALDEGAGTSHGAFRRVQVKVAEGSMAGQTVWAYEGARVFAITVLPDGVWEPGALFTQKQKQP